MSPGTGATQSVVVTLWVKRGLVLIVPWRDYARAVMVYSHQVRSARSPGLQASIRLTGHRASYATVSSRCCRTVVPIEQISRLVGHSGTTTTETIYRKQIRPVITGGAEVMDRLFPGDSPDAEPEAPNA